MPLNPKWIKLDLPNRRVDWSNQSSLPLALSSARWEAVRPAKGHKSWDFPSYSGQHTGLPHRGNEGQRVWLTRRARERERERKKGGGRVGSCDLIKVLCISHTVTTAQPRWCYSSGVGCISVETPTSARYYKKNKYLTSYSVCSVLHTLNVTITERNLWNNAKICQ